MHIRCQHWLRRSGAKRHAAWRLQLGWAGLNAVEVTQQAGLHKWQLGICIRPSPLPVVDPAAPLSLATPRYEKRHRNISAHVSPCFRVKEGDSVVIGQCRWAAQGAGWRCRAVGCGFQVGVVSGYLQSRAAVVGGLAGSHRRAANLAELHRSLGHGSGWKAFCRSAKVKAISVLS